jgi:hypothetical protein
MLEKHMGSSVTLCLMKVSIPSFNLAVAMEVSSHKWLGSEKLAAHLSLMLLVPLSV